MSPSVKNVLCLSIVVFLASPSLEAWEKNWRKRSEKDAKKVIRKATEATGAGFGEAFGAMVGGKLTSVYATWLTDPVLRALARITELQERRTEDEAVTLYESLKARFSEHYAFYVNVSSLWISAYSQTGFFEDEVADTENPNRIFLQYPKDKKKFLRPVAAEKSIPEISRIGSLAKIPSREDAMILFPRDEEFVRGSGGKLELEVVQDGKKRRIEFKIKDLVKDPSQL